MVEPTQQETKIFSSEKSDEHKNKFGKGQSPLSELITGTNVSTPQIIKY